MCSSSGAAVRPACARWAGPAELASRLRAAAHHAGYSSPLQAAFLCCTEPGTTLCAQPCPAVPGPTLPPQRELEATRVEALRHTSEIRRLEGEVEESQRRIRTLMDDLDEARNPPTPGGEEGGLGGLQGGGVGVGGGRCPLCTLR